MTVLAVGMQLHSAVSATSVIVVRPGDSDGELCCGGTPMLAVAPAAPVAPLDPELADGALLGKRYIDEASGLEVMCTKAGEGTLTFAGERLAIKAPASLPSSD